MRNAILMVLLAVVSSSAAAASLADCVELTSSLNKNYPTQVDKNTTLTGLVCIPAERKEKIVLRYMFKLAFPKRETTAMSISTQKVNIKNGVCSYPDKRMLNWFDVEYFYNDSDNHFVFSTIIRERDCKK